MVVSNQEQLWSGNVNSVVALIEHFVEVKSSVNVSVSPTCILSGLSFVHSSTVEYVVLQFGLTTHISKHI